MGSKVKPALFILIALFQFVGKLADAREIKLKYWTVHGSLSFDRTLDPADEIGILGVPWVNSAKHSTNSTL